MPFEAGATQGCALPLPTNDYHVFRMQINTKHMLACAGVSSNPRAITFQADVDLRPAGDLPRAATPGVSQVCMRACLRSRVPAGMHARLHKHAGTHPHHTRVHARILQSICTRVHVCMRVRIHTRQ